MDMSRIRKPVNVTLNPALVERLRVWCGEQRPVVAFGRAVDDAIEDYLAKKEAKTDEN